MLKPNVRVRIEKNRLKYFEHYSDGPDRGNSFELLNGRKVDEFFYSAIIQDVQVILDGVESDTYYTTKDMCSENLWLSLSPWNRKVAGMCVADAVLRGSLSV